MRSRSAWRAAVCVLITGCAGTQASQRPSLQPVAAATAAPEPPPRRVGSPYAYEWFVRAEIFRAHTELEPALEAYRLALASSDDDPHVWSRYATALDEAGHTARALEAVKNALAQDPLSEAAWLARAAIAERHGQLEDALEAYERAEASAPTSARPPLALSALLDERGNAERARAVLARYEARVLPGTSGALRARLRAAVSRHDPQAAYVEARALGDAKAEDIPLLTHAAVLLLETDHCGLAVELLDALGERAAQAALQLRALLACARFDSVEALLRVTDPELLGGMLPVAHAYLAIGRAQQAIELAQAYLLTHPEDRQAQLLLAQAQLASGAVVDAAESFAVLAQGPNADDAKQGLARALTAAGMHELASEVAQPTAAAANSGEP